MTGTERAHATRSPRPGTVRWGILGPGRIARKFAAGLREAEGAELVAVGSRDPGRAAAFAAEFGVPRAHGSHADLAADPELDAVYVGTPHAHHEAHTLLCLEAGKHVLCEKPLALNSAQAGRMIGAARTRSLVLMEAMWTRFLPAIAHVRDVVTSGRIGDVRMVVADFGFRAEFDPASRLFAPELGGGALLDVGIYPLNLAFMLCGEPLEIHTTANLGATGVDEEAALLLRHAGGRISVLACALRVDTPREAQILGTKGAITIGFPWWAATRISIRTGGQSPEELAFPHRGGGYTHEAEAFMALVRSGQLESEIMPLDENLAILRTMDTIRARWGMRYPGE
jgi:predicted dehydrogenase